MSIVATRTGVGPLLFETLTDDLIFPEGPVALTDGAILVVDCGARTLVRIEADGCKSVIARCGGGPNGAAIGPDGAVYVCNNGGVVRMSRDSGRLVMEPDTEGYVGGSIQRVDLVTGDVHTLYKSCDGLPLLAPNDLVFDGAGGFWFTDSGLDLGDSYRKGAIFYARADGTSIVARRRGLAYPNGIGLSPDGTVLYWASTTTGRLFADPIGANGSLSSPRPWSQGTLLHNAGAEELLDSLAIEADGRVCVARVQGGIRVVETDGSWEDIPVDDTIVTNLCFGGPDGRDVWMTAAASGRVLRGRWPRPGFVAGAVL